MAAAYAEDGDFEDAVKWEKKPIEAGFSNERAQKRAEERLKLYESGKPYREE